MENKDEELQKEVDEARKKIAELEAKAATPPVSFAGDASGAGSRQLLYYKCGGMGHFARSCPTQLQGNAPRSYWSAARKGQPNDVRPIRGKQTRSCIDVKYRRHRLHALLDTGSDITVAGNNLANKFKWEICPHPTKSVKIANGEEMVLYGAVYVPLRVGKKDIDSEILISPDITGLIIGIQSKDISGTFASNES